MSVALYRLAGIGLACALVMPASAQLLARKDLSAAMALAIAETTIATCKANGYSVSVAVVGRNGELLVHVRGDGTGPHTMENSFRKAYSARTFRQSSGDFAKRMLKPGEPAGSLTYLTNVIPAQGALPIKIGEETIGAVGASGAPGGEKDEACVKAGIDKVAADLK
jgi:uncharacterized protein GlcG (DUF336 family)